MQYIKRDQKLYFTNFRYNLSEPKRFINHIFQRSFADAGTDLSRFVINSTIGLAGLIDVATLWEIYPKPTNFDETFAHEYSMWIMWKNSIELGGQPPNTELKYKLDNSPLKRAPNHVKSLMLHLDYTKHFPNPYFGELITY